MLKKRGIIAAIVFFAVALTLNFIFVKPGTIQYFLLAFTVFFAILISMYGNSKK